MNQDEAKVSHGRHLNVLLTPGTQSAPGRQDSFLSNLYQKYIRHELSSTVQNSAVDPAWFAKQVRRSGVSVWQRRLDALPPQ